MSVVKDVYFIITGQVEDDVCVNDYEVVKKEIELICAKWKLKLEEKED